MCSKQRDFTQESKQRQKGNVEKVGHENGGEAKAKEYFFPQLELGITPNNKQGTG